MARHGRTLNAVVDHDGQPGQEDLAIAVCHDFAGPLYGFVLTLTGGDRLWAEDVVQETLIRAWRNADKINREPDMLRSWLHTVARRIVIDGWRSKRARPQEVEEPEADAVCVPDESDRTLAAIVVHHAMDDLSPEHREALLHTYIRDRTVNEAAVSIGVPPGTVKSRLHHAVRALRRALQEAT